MQITPEEAQQSLDEIERVIARTRKTIANRGTDLMLILWGVIWVLGYGLTQFFPLQAGLFWMPLVVIGSVGSWTIGVRKAAVKGSIGWRIGVFWFTLFAYAGLWLFLLAPFNETRIGAFMATVPMFAYVVGGLWFGRFFVFLGLGVTAATILGVVAGGNYFNLWMAVAGGGALIWSGIYINRNWK
jgi:hypothetical protein